MNHYEFDVPTIKEFDLLQNVINAVPTPIFYKNAKGKYLGCNTAFESFIGMSKHELIGFDVFELFDADLAEVYNNADQALLAEGGTQIYEARVKYADGSLHDVMFHKAILKTKVKEFNGVVGAILDITERKKMEKQLKQIAHKDCLTGLNNRYALLRKLKKAIKKMNFTCGTYISLDLDGFKQVNDLYGHPVGDKFLIEVGHRISTQVGEQGMVARIGGDEFAILIFEQKVSQQNSITKLSKKVQSLLDALMVLMEKPIIIRLSKHRTVKLNVSFSLGVSSIDPCKKSNVESILKSADRALYKAKREGKGRWSLQD